MINGQFEPFLGLNDFLNAKYLALALNIKLGDRGGPAKKETTNYISCVLVLVRSERGEEGSFKR